MGWLFRAGSLLTSLLSTIPLWRGFDPLPILSISERERRRREQERKRAEAEEALKRRKMTRLLDEVPGRGVRR